MKNGKLKNILLILLPLTAAVMNALPNAIKMTWALGPDETSTSYYSGYNMIAAGYGDWSPMLTGVGAIILTIMGICNACKGSSELRRNMQGVAIAATFICLIQIPMGSMTWVGVVIDVLLATTALILTPFHRMVNRERKE